jgi:HD-GYP domain-containing protein (c-di-GMP phosphodiesterase class II)
MTSAELASKCLSHEQTIALPELVSALTFALDLAEGATPGHGLRCCVLGMRVGAAIGVAPEDLTALYYALLLKDIGCSNNAARMTQVVGGDDRAVKGIAKMTDWTSVIRSSNPRSVALLWKQVLPRSGVHRRAARMLSLAVRQRRNNRLMIELRCERGREIVRKLKMGETAAMAVYHLDEHWDGRGYPERLRGESIPLLSRVCAIAQNLDIFAALDGPQAAVDVLRRRRGSWFDPELVAAVERLHGSEELWRDCMPGDSPERCRELVMEMEPTASGALLCEEIDTLCEAFADVVDAKSPFAYRHSRHVAEVATGLARILRLSPERERMLRRAALLHDLGKLSMPNTILDKPGPLTGQEWVVVRRHPALTRSILERVAAFAELAVVAGEHHEQLDGSGYPRGLTADKTSFESRLLAMADQFAGMTERRPYHPGYEPAEALELMRTRVPAKLDPECFEALERLVRGDVGHAQLQPDFLLELV